MAEFKDLVGHPRLSRKMFKCRLHTRTEVRASSAWTILYFAIGLAAVGLALATVAWVAAPSWKFVVANLCLYIVTVVLIEGYEPLLRRKWSRWLVARLADGTVMEVSPALAKLWRDAVEDVTLEYHVSRNDCLYELARSESGQALIAQLQPGDYKTEHSVLLLLRRVVASRLPGGPPPLQ